MKQLRVLLLFIFVFLLGGGTAYAQSADDGAADPSSTRQETVAVATETKIETSRANETVAEGEASDPIQEPPMAAEEDKQEPESVETPEADQAKATETETAEEKEQVISDDKEEADDEKSANDLSEEGDSPVEADQEEKVKPEEEHTEESKANETEAEEAETDAVDKTEKTAQEGEVLEKGTVLDPEVLKANVPAEETKGNVKEVSSFEELKKALEDAEDGVETTIVVTESFEISETLTIGERKIITLTSKDKKPMDEKWKPIEQPKDYADQGEKKQEKSLKKPEDVVKKLKQRLQKVFRGQVLGTAQSGTTSLMMRILSLKEQKIFSAPCST